MQRLRIETTCTESFIQVDGLAKIATSCLEVLFGSYSANQSSTTTYAISTGSLGGVARIDADFYSYQYNSSTLSKITKNVVVVSIVISSAKIDGLDQNDVSTIVQTVYSNSTSDQQEKIRDQIWASIQKDKPKTLLRSTPGDTYRPPQAPNSLDRLLQTTFDSLNHGDMDFIKAKLGSKAAPNPPKSTPRSFYLSESGRVPPRGEI
jgi:hypothetical protein